MPRTPGTLLLFPLFASVACLLSTRAVGGAYGASRGGTVSPTCHPSKESVIATAPDEYLRHADAEVARLEAELKQAAKGESGAEERNTLRRERLSCLFVRALSLKSMKRVHDALKAFKAVIKAAPKKTRRSSDGDADDDDDNDNGDGNAAAADAARPSIILPRTHYHIADITYLELGDSEGAKKHLDRSLSLNPDDPDPLLMTGNFFMERGKMREALGMMRRATEHGPGFITFLSLSMACGMVGDARCKFDSLGRAFDHEVPDGMQQMFVDNARKELDEYRNGKGKNMGNGKGSNGKGKGKGQRNNKGKGGGDDPHAAAVKKCSASKHKTPLRRLACLVGAGSEYAISSLQRELAEKSGVAADTSERTRWGAGPSLLSGLGGFSAVGGSNGVQAVLRAIGEAEAAGKYSSSSDGGGSGGGDVGSVAEARKSRRIAASLLAQLVPEDNGMFGAVLESLGVAEYESGGYGTASVALAEAARREIEESGVAPSRASMPLRLKLAESLYRTGDFKGAVRVYQSLFESHGDRVPITVRNHLARACLNARDYLCGRENFEIFSAAGETERRDSLRHLWYSRAQLVDWAHEPQDRESMLAMARSLWRKHGHHWGAGTVPAGPIEHLPIPYQAMHMPFTNTEQLLLTKLYALNEDRTLRLTLPPSLIDRREKPPPRYRRPLRIGVLSGNFGNHPAGRHFSRVFEALDAARRSATGGGDEGFTVVYSTGGDDGSSAYQNAKRSAHSFREFRNVDTTATVLNILSDKLDVLVDLSGWTMGGSSSLFGARLAPVQAIAQGYVGTMGTRHHDYILGDRVACPAEMMRDGHTEKVAYLGLSGSSNDTAPSRAPDGRPIAGGTWRGSPHPRLFFPNHHAYDDTAMVTDPPPADTHVPMEILSHKATGGKVMCNFGRAFKLDPLALTAWLRILQRVPGSIIWMVDFGTEGEHRLRELIPRMNMGIDKSRLVVTPFLERSGHLVGKRACDLYLDTPKYNSHTTAIESLWSGVPIVTMTASRMSSRVTASALAVLGLEEELVATSFGEYVDKAVRMLTDEITAGRVRRIVEHARPGDRAALKQQSQEQEQEREHDLEKPDGVDRDAGDAAGSGATPVSTLWDTQGWTEEFLRVLHVAYEVKVAKGKAFHIA